jgi:phage regulator Rha-like protein
MNQRISVATSFAINLWNANPQFTPSKCAKMAGISHTTILRAIKRLKLKRKK